MEFKIEFTHTVEEYYFATVEASSEEEAESLFNEDPFKYVKDGDEEPFDSSGIDIDINSIKINNK